MRDWLTCKFRMGSIWGLDCTCDSLQLAIIDHIAHQMRSMICKTIKENKGKLSILIDESTTVFDISILIVYLKAQLEKSGEPQFLFLDLVELTNGESADEIHKALVACLKRHGFDMDYLQEHFIAFTSDWASVLTGKKSSEGFSKSHHLALFEPSIRTCS